MRVEEAIKILDPETTREAVGDLPHDEAVKKVDEACIAAVEIMRKWQKVNYESFLDVTDENNKTLFLNVCPALYDVIGRIMVTKTGTKDCKMFYVDKTG
jgi:Mg/Co/Ni transporter MgtE